MKLNKVREIISLSLSLIKEVIGKRGYFDLQ